MIHKFVANDNKGNVNVLEVTSTGTKLGKVAAPVEDTDAATKKYVDDNIGGGSGSNKFIVTLTPTAADYSGTMDKTVEEITAAYEAGQEIVFKLQTSATAYIEVPVQLVGHETTRTYPSFETSVVQSDANLQVFASTDVTNDGTKQTYSTKVYSLTPAS